MQREPMVFFVAGMLFGGVLGYMAATVGSSSEPRVIPVGEQAAARPGAAVEEGGGRPRGATPPDANEVRALESLAARDKANAQVRLELGNLLMDHQAYAEAARWYEEALALTPDNNDVRVDLGACLVNMGKPEQGLARFEEALKRDPNHKKALYNKGVALMESGRPKDAVAVWEDLVKRFPDDPQLAGLRQQIEQVRASQKPS